MANLESYYWPYLSLAILAYLLAYALQTDMGNRRANSGHLPAQLLYAAAASWALTLSPVNLHVVAWVTAMVLQAAVTSGLTVVGIALIVDTRVDFAPSARTAVSLGALLAIAAYAGYGAYTLLSHSDEPPPAAHRTDESAWIGERAVALAASPFLLRLEVFVSVTQGAIAIATFVIRKVAGVKHFNPRYHNSTVAAFCILVAAASAALRALPPLANVAAHRALLWVALYVATAFRRARVRVYYAPVRNFQGPVPPSHPLAKRPAYGDELVLPEAALSASRIRALCMV